MNNKNNFSDYYYNNIIKEWQNEYIDYNKIKKQILNGKIKVLETLREDNIIKYYGKNDIFTITIDNIKYNIIESMKSIQLFYILKEGELLRLIYRLFIEFKSLDYENVKLVSKFLKNFVINLTLYKNLTEFINLNLLALNIILEKMDIEFKVLNSKILYNFFKDNLDKNDVLKILIEQKGILKGFFTMKKIFELFKVNFEQKTEFILKCEFDSIVLKKKSTTNIIKNDSNIDKDIILINDFIKQNINKIETKLPTLNFNEESILSKKITMKKSQTDIKKDIYNNYNNICKNINLNIDYIEEVKIKLKNKLDIQKNNFKKDIFLIEIENLFNIKELSEEDFIDLEKLNNINNKDNDVECYSLIDLWLILIGTSIFIFNYYGWSINSKEYLKFIGLDEKYLGMISAITPFASFIMVFILNYTTQFGFKISTYVCLLLLIIGNILYFIAYIWKDLYILLIGKILVGLGGCRLLPRKFLALMVKENFRTKYSAIFVGMTCISTGLGPGLVYYINKINIGNNLFWINDFNKFTLIVIILWIIYSILFFILFKDNKKQINKELLKSKYKQLAITKIFVNIDKKIKSNNINDIRNYLNDNMHSNLKYFHDKTMNLKNDVCKNASLNINNIKKDHFNKDDIEKNNIYLNKSQNIIENKFKEYNLTTLKKYFPNKSTVIISFLVLYSKFVQETLVNEISLSYKALFNDKIYQIGLFFLILIIYSLFFSLLMIKLSKKFEDRVITLFGVCFTVIACLLKTDFLTIFYVFDKTNKWYFNITSALVYIGTLIMEGSAISLLSKVINPSFQLGFLNSGLITGAFDTLGKALGNTFISIFQIIVSLIFLKSTKKYQFVYFLGFLYFFYSIIGIIFLIFIIIYFKQFRKYFEIKQIVNKHEIKFDKNN